MLTLVVKTLKTIVLFVPLCIVLGLFVSASFFRCLIMTAGWIPAWMREGYSLSGCLVSCLFLAGTLPFVIHSCKKRALECGASTKEEKIRVAQGCYNDWVERYGKARKSGKTRCQSCEVANLVLI